MAYIALVVAQLIYTSADLWRKTIFNAQQFSLSTLTKPLFLLTVVVTLAAFVIQMYALSKIDLSRMAVVLGMLAVIFSVGAGVIVLKESFNVWNLLGVFCAMAAIFLIHVRTA